MTENELMIINENKNLKDKVKFNVPEILLIDCEDVVTKSLKEKGFNIEVGSFGKKYKILDNTYMNQCFINSKIDNILDKDVIVVDMKQNQTDERIPLKSMYSLGDGDYLITKEKQTWFNPINIASRMRKEEFLKLKDKNSIFIIFADEVVKEKYFVVNKSSSHYRNRKEDEISNYNFLPFDIYPNNVETQKYKIMDNVIAKKFFKGYEEKIYSKCTFDIGDYNRDKTLELLKNQYDELIGYLQIFQNGETKNVLIVLPQCQNKSLIIENILTEVLPNIYPDIFQDFTKDLWIDDDEYILPKVKDILIEKQNIEKEYNQKLTEIEERIKKEKDDNQFLYDIIISTGTGDKLVKAIIKCLEYLEYYKIQDMDELTRDGEREEDLHIYKSENEYFIAEVKGVNGPAIEDDCNVIVKYKSRNCDKLGIPVIHFIVFFNYHKNVEPNQREELGLTQKEIKDAQRDNYTLVGTYQLFKAIRLCQEGIISKKDIKKALETPGIFKAIPNTFQLIGKIDNLLNNKNVICIPLECEELKIDDELLIVENNSYYKAKVISMQVNEKDKQLAKKGDKVGLKIDGKIPKSKSAQIYLIK